MNGKYLLDTNAVIALLNNNSEIQSLLKSTKWLGITVITELEFLSFSNLSKNDNQLFEQFKNKVTIIGLDTKDSLIIKKIIEIRQTYNLKLPDAIIAGITICSNATLVTNDSIFKRVINLSIKNF